MRRIATLAVLFGAVTVGCAKEPEKAAGDVTSSAVPATTMSLEEMSGTWEGKTYAVPGDSLMSSWTAMGGADGNGKMVDAAAPNDTVLYTTVVDADSMISTSSAYTDRTLPAGTPQVMWRAVGRLTGAGKLAGTGTVMLASKPDSVVATSRWEATKKP